ncbi:MAG: tetratricopeptide repeat protein [Bryobacterales bacterium]|nr:tetratricopeptide repeat protein [Bryobacteraceae bacterium]MDW8355093.1 tetratricopeptide repeat protein [Bryobacterales bacterium]
MHRRFGLVLMLCSVAPLWAERIVILPFCNRSGLAAYDWIGESLAESIREALGRASVAVVSRDQREAAYEGLGLGRFRPLTKATVWKLSEASGATTAVFGSFRVQSASGTSTLELEAQILDRVEWRNGPSFQLQGALDELGRLQDELAWRVLRALRPGGPDLERLRARRRPVRLDAWEQYIRGLLAETAEQQHRYFAQAARLDENLSQARFLLGKLLWRKKECRVAAGWLEQVRRDDIHYPEATYLLGLCAYQAGDYEKAALSFQTLSRSTPAPEVWNNLGASQSRLNLPEALDSFRKALEASPQDSVYRFNVGYALWRRGAYEAAAEMFRAVLRAQPQDAIAMTMLGRCLRRSGPGRVESRAEALERLKHNLPAALTEASARAQMPASAQWRPPRAHYN